MADSCRHHVAHGKHAAGAASRRLSDTQKDAQTHTHHAQSSCRSALITPPPAGCRIYRVAVVRSLGANQTSVPAKRAHEEGESVVTGRTWLSPVTLRPIFSYTSGMRVLAFTTSELVAV